ncbi:hypothetical protein KHM83_05820 [Fusibacter paucivorans]|uniref:Uncharacterized protein n=1 Tax=Fusibacter paucivorans TaxID=76009 RepID=A0ABS5PNN4_9FIRM|nr:hypothetical protein [Fusibacter paucivorans]MBS7526186.1 hypothetical protein [Fusibacter paucivorans]
MPKASLEALTLEVQACVTFEADLRFDPIVMNAVQRKLKWSADLGLMPETPCNTLEDLYDRRSKNDVI